ncbi:hypothetical protein K8R30_03040 [archaeon]|nr:hypothetical protein [archaeon]
MQLKRKLSYSAAVSLGALLTSIFLPIIPCRTAPGVPSPVYKWTLCSLNPDQINTLTSTKEYLGYTTSLSKTYLIILSITFIIAMIFFHYTIRKKKSKRGK